MKITLDNGSKVTPVATFNKGDSHFIVDDGCYVLVNHKLAEDYYVMSPWIFPEALKVLRSLPDLPGTL